MTWSTEQILALAPDASSAKAGRQLATPRPWSNLGADDRALWGECKGSGEAPYQVQIDREGPAFQCSCPSRKLPCKHALGLFLIWVGTPAELPPGAAPARVREWLKRRDQRAARKAIEGRTPSGAPSASPTEVPAAVGAGGTAEKATARRPSAERYVRVAAGLDEFERWLADLVRLGFAAVQGRPSRFWAEPAARLVDAQAPGLARRLRELATIPASGEGWPERLLERLGLLYLGVEGFRRLSALTPETQADLRALLGLPESQEEILVGPGLREEWLVLGARVTREDRLRVQRTWLRGRESGRAALILQFAHGNQALDHSLPAGAAADAELVFFPSAHPLRALVKARHGPPAPLRGIPGHNAIADAVAAYSGALAAQPWLEQFPVPLTAVVPVRWNQSWVVRDAAGDFLPLARGFARGWNLRALSGGQPLAFFGEWDGEALLPLSAWSDGRFYNLARSEH
jgi:hypothetical protein